MHGHFFFEAGKFAFGQVFEVGGAPPVYGLLAQKPVLEGVEVTQGGATAAAGTDGGGCVGHRWGTFLRCMNQAAG